MKKTVLFLILGILFSLPVLSRNFVHPGSAHKLSDLERMRYMVQAGVDPYLTSFNQLKSDPLSSYNYSVAGTAGITSLPQTALDGYFGKDSRAAYMNALMWILTADERHAQKAVEIFNTYKDLTFVDVQATAGLNAGKCYIIIEAAELIKSTYNGWAAGDMQKFKDMLVYPGYSTTEKPSGTSTFYWGLYRFDSGRHGNQELIPMRACMAMGVFLDNEIMYDRALRYFKGLSHREDDFSYDAGPGVSVSEQSRNEYFIAYNHKREETTPDYGFNGVLKHYIWENGQCQESSRDQDHAILGMGVCAHIAEIAWNQGEDVYSLEQDRILKGYEYATRYNVSYIKSYEDQTTPWEPAEPDDFYQRTDRTGRWKSLKISPHYESDFVRISRGNFTTDKRPIYEIALAHYGVRAGKTGTEMKWTQRALDYSNEQMGYEQSGWTTDHLGWGALTMHRPVECAGDPCSFSEGKPTFAMNALPGTIEAENYDFYPGNGQGFTYNDNTTNNSGNIYRNDNVDIKSCSEGGYQLTSMEAGEWLNYTVFVPVTGNYEIKVRYSAAIEGGKLKITFGGTDQTGEISLPVTGNDTWTDFVLAGNANLEAGVQNMRLYVTGTSNAIELNNITVSARMQGDKKITLSGSESAGSVSLTWSYENMIPTNQKIYRGISDDFSTATILADHVSGTIYTDDTAQDNVNYYYWIKGTDNEGNILSNFVKVISSLGHINDIFNTETSLWNIATSGASTKTENEQLVVTMASQSSGKYRGDIRRSGGITLHAGNYPILAIKIQRPQIVNITLDTERGSFGNGANKHSGILGTNKDILYYDLTAKEFTKSDGSLKLPLDEPFTFSTFQFKVADVSSGETSYTVDWIKTFRSLEELEDFTTKTGITEIKTNIPDLTYYIINKTLYLENLSETANIRIINLQGNTIAEKKNIQSATSFQLPQTGVYIVNINTGNNMHNIKVFSH